MFLNRCQAQTIFTLPVNSQVSNHVRTLLLPSQPVQDVALLSVIPSESGGHDSAPAFNIGALSHNQYHVMTPDMQTVMPIPVNRDHAQPILFPAVSSSVDPRSQLQTILMSNNNIVLGSRKQVQTVLVPNSGGGNSIQQLQTALLSENIVLDSRKQIQTLLVPSNGGRSSIQQLQTALLSENTIVFDPRKQVQTLLVPSSIGGNSIQELQPIVLPVNSSIAKSGQQVQTIIVPANRALPSQGTVFQTVIVPSTDVEAQPNHSAHAFVLPDINTLSHIQAVSPNAASVTDSSCQFQVLLTPSATESLEVIQQQRNVVAIPVSEVLVPSSNTTSEALTLLADSQSVSNNLLFYLPQEGLVVEVPNSHNEEQARQWYQDSEIVCRGLAALRQVLPQLLSFENITLNSPTGTSPQQTFQTSPVDMVCQEEPAIADENIQNVG
ncbi:uncharacterized protein LOC106474033 isoform X2 [Limulus polyphemus]|uniref:Uncharacterized protein LOC106474033 isoform X2 n=1 Tax=Limulus polyphemus TaxID=6850 RepID=A0ABM1TQG7_LIMPO|nr:uncharacterized protein LOC106474033 isoform X2 [Limulus polyphemus]